MPEEMHFQPRDELLTAGEILTVARAARDLGFDKSTVTNPFCASCSRVRLCLLRDDEGDLRTLLRNGASFEALRERLSELVLRLEHLLWIAREDLDKNL
jgi:molybdenum cofactor biosynthesis enzyme MoaA